MTKAKQRLDARTMVGLVSIALIALMVSCIVATDDDDDDDADDGRPASAHRHAALSGPALAAALDGADLVPTAPIEARLAEDGARIASQRFTALLEGARFDGTLSCTARCTGPGCSGATGCEPAGNGCSPHACTGGCAATCTEAVAAAP